MMVKIIKGIETDKWLPKELRKGTFPILRQPAMMSNDITGSAFLLQYKNKPFVITAKHGKPLVRSETFTDWEALVAFEYFCD